MNKNDARALIEKGEATERDLKEVMKLYGASVPEGMITDALSDPVEVRFPVVLKVSDARILHKSDVGGVRVGIRDRETLMNEFKTMSGKFPGSQFLIEEMADDGVEAIIGVIKDANFGHVIMLGMGGIYTEMYHDVVFRLLPIERIDAEEMIRGVKLSRFLKGFRGKKISEAKLVNLLLAVSSLVEEIGKDIRQLDLNPIILGENSAVVVDAKLISGKA